MAQTALQWVDTSNLQSWNGRNSILAQPEDTKGQTTLEIPDTHLAASKEDTQAQTGIQPWDDHQAPSEDGVQGRTASETSNVVGKGDRSGDGTREVVDLITETDPQAQPTESLGPFRQAAEKAGSAAARLKLKDVELVNRIKKDFADAESTCNGDG